VVKVPNMPHIGSAIDNAGQFLREISDYLASLEEIEPEIELVEQAYGPIEPMVRSIIMIPGSGDFVYDTAPVYVRGFDEEGEWVFGGSFNLVNQGPPTNWSSTPPSGPTDVVVALDQLQERFPNIENVSLVVSWFGTDLRAGECKILPGSSTHRTRGEIRPAAWRVGDYLDPTAPGDDYNGHLISEIEIEPGLFALAYGGTPTDASVVRCIQEMNRRGLKVTFYPFILMDVPAGNSLQNPYGGASQPPYPWRGRITCHPAPGQPGTVDKTATARTQLNSFAAQYEPMIKHYADLCASAGGVDAFIIGTEMRGVTWVRDQNGAHPFVECLIGLAAYAKAKLPGAKITYASDWSEFTPYQVPEGGLDFHLDALWMSPDIDAIGIDNYWPLSDWRGVTGIDEDLHPNIYDLGYLLSNVQGGEGYDFYYASDADRINQVRSPITSWEFRYKDIRGWWENYHHNRPDWAWPGFQTVWVPQSKPIWFTEIGCPAVDKGTNQPNVFIDPKSSESFFPYFSTGVRDDLIQRRYIAAHHLWWATPEQNPISDVYGGEMLDQSRIYVYCWDARPYPDFPEREDVWGDGPNWQLGHWVQGRETDFPAPPISPDNAEILDVMPVTPMPKDGRAVDPKTGFLEEPYHRFIAQIETVMKRFQNLQITAIRETQR